MTQIPESILRSISYYNNLPNPTSPSGSSFEFHQMQRNAIIQQIRQRLWDLGYSLQDINDTITYDARVATPKDDFIDLRDLQRDIQTELFDKQRQSADIDFSTERQYTLPYEPQENIGVEQPREYKTFTVVLVVGIVLLFYLNRKK